MRKKKWVSLLAIAAVAMLAVGVSMAGGKGKGKKPKPPPCDCPEVLVLPNGLVCTLEDCGSDCVYVCPLPE